MGRTVSAYFVYCDKNRAETKAALQEERGGEKVSVAQVAKALGEKWRQLSDEEKKHFQQVAAELTSRSHDEDSKENADPSSQAEKAQQGKDSSDEHQFPFGFPLSLVKRIMTMDKDLHSVSADALKMTAKAAELIVQLLAAKAGQVAAQNKRKTIQFRDVQIAIAKDKRWDLSGMKELMAHDELFEEARNSQNVSRPKKPVEIDPKAQQITSFFKA